MVSPLRVCGAVALASLGSPSSSGFEAGRAWYRRRLLRGRASSCQQCAGIGEDISLSTVCSGNELSSDGDPDGTAQLLASFRSTDALGRDSVVTDDVVVDDLLAHCYDGLISSRCDFGK